MRDILFALIIIIEIKCTLLIKTQTSDVNHRLAVLKFQLSQDIKGKQYSVIPPEHDVDPMELNVGRSGRVTPISRHRTKKFGSKRTTAKTTTTATTTEHLDRAGVENVTEDNIDESTSSALRLQQIKAKAKKWAKHLKKYGKPVEIFYRRHVKGKIDEEERKRRHALLCVDLLRPILNGMKKNATTSKVLGDHIVNRLIQLLSSGNGRSPEDIHSILYQINGLQLRFFQWDVSAIKKLFNFIMPGQRHSFRSMKHGIKKIFELWHMDLSDTAILVKDARMFRPPCIGTSEGSTRSSTTIRYTKPTTPKSTCAPKDEMCQRNNDEYDFVLGEQ